VSQSETHFERITIEEDDWTPEGQGKEPEAEEQLYRFEGDEEQPKGPDLTQARSLLTELRPAGFGEVLVTEIWYRPEPRVETPPKPKKGEDGEPAETAEPRPRDPHKEWEQRQELRDLGLLRERPLLSHDARYEIYWTQVRDTRAEAVNAIVDPYTEFARQFADADIDNLSEHRRGAQEYGREGGALLELGRGYVAIGRHKAARSVLERAAKMEPLHPGVWYNLGIARLFGRANAKAREALEQAVDQAPGDPHSQLALGVACYHLKDYAAAETHLARVAGSSGMRAAARSMLVCCHRLQGNWDEARVELNFLKEAAPGDWAALAKQCLECVDRGEQKRGGFLRLRRRASKMWKALAAAAASAIWLAYSLIRNLFEKDVQWAVIPLFILVLLLVRSLKGISGRELSDEFGNAEQGLPCWRSTTWIRPRQPEF
jgi:tetratricopeptide (TPR) repeat protein